MNKNSELKMLVFWAHVGLGYSYSGSHADKMPKIIVKYMKKLGMTPSDFACFKSPLDSKKLSNDVLREYNRQKYSRKGKSV